MILNSRIYKNLLRKGIPFLILLLLISFRSISQTTDTSRPITIPASKALRIAKDLEAFKFLKSQDSVNRENIVLYKKQISLDSTKMSLQDQKIDFQSQMINGLNDKSKLQQTVSDTYKKQVTTYKWERNGLGILALILIGKLIIK